MKIQQITKIAILTTIFSIACSIVIPFGFIPISLSTLFLCILSTILKPKEILISIVLYLFLGIIGIPVFAGFQAGFGVLIGPTGGYLIGYLFSGFVMSLINQNVKSKSLWLFSFLIGLLILYFFGTIHFMFIMKLSFIESIAVTVYQYVIGDIIEIILAYIISLILNKIFTNYQ